MRNGNQFTRSERFWNRRQHRWYERYAIGLACLPGLVGCSPDQTTAKETEVTAAAPVPVRVARVQLTTLRPSIDLVGTLVAIPERTAVIAAQTKGRIQTVSVVEGEMVKSGQTLFRLDTRPAKAEKLRAEALVNQQRAVLDRLKNGYLPQEIEVARQEAQRAKSDLETLRLRVNASETLHKNHEVSDIEFKKLQSLMQREKAAYAAAAAKLNLYQVGTRPEVIEEAQAQLDVAQAELTRAQLAVQFCTLLSPVEGIVTQLPARRGMHIAPSDRLATVVDMREVFVQIRVPNAYLSSVKLGARAEVLIPSLQEDRFEGQVTRFSGEADPNTGDVQAFATLQNEEGLLRPGLACRVRVWLPPVEQALVVPISAIADRGGLSVLHVVRDNKAYELTVSIGADTREYVQVTDGVSVSDLVITEGGYGLPEGCPVKTTSP